VADDDFAEMGAALEVAVCGRRLFKREYPVNDGAQSMQCDCPVHRLEIGSAADADRAETHAAAAQQERVEHDIGDSCIAGVPGLVLFAELCARLACGVDCTRVNGHQARRRLQSDSGRRQIIHDSAQSGVGFGFQAAVPGSSDKVVNLAIACAAQRPYQGFCLI